MYMIEIFAAVGCTKTEYLWLRLSRERMICALKDMKSIIHLDNNYYAPLLFILSIGFPITYYLSITR